MFTPAALPLHPAVAASLAKWHAMVAATDLSDLPDIVHADAVFLSPMAYKGYAGRDTVVRFLRTVLTVFDEFTYHREFASADGLSVTLEFSARVGPGGKVVKGVDLIRFGEDGLVREFEVLVRPMSGLKALGGEMAVKMGFKKPGKMPEFVGKL